MFKKVPAIFFYNITYVIRVASNEAPPFEFPMKDWLLIIIYFLWGFFCDKSVTFQVLPATQEVHP